MKRSVIGLLVISLVSTHAVGRSIDDINPRRLPKVGLAKRLSLSGRGISSLEGINAIRGIEGARIINLSNNELSRIEEGALASAKKLRGLNLSNNQLTGEGLRGLIGLDNLQVLILDSNNIETIPQQVLKGLPRLRVIIIRNNPISGQSIKLLRNDGYVVYTLPMVLTGANIKRALFVTGAVAAIVLGALAAKEGYRAGKEYFKNRAEALEMSANQDKDKARILGESATLPGAGKVVKKHVKFLEDQAVAKLTFAEYVRQENLKALEKALQDQVRDVEYLKNLALADLDSGRYVGVTPSVLEAFIKELDTQKSQLEDLLTQLGRRQDGSGETLEDAVASGSLPTLRKLLDEGANINERFGDQQLTPLMLAVVSRNMPMIELLVSKGADVTLRDAEGRTAADIAWEERHRGEHSTEYTSIALFLEKQGGPSSEGSGQSDVDPIKAKLRNRK